MTVTQRVRYIQALTVWLLGSMLVLLLLDLLELNLLFALSIIGLTLLNEVTYPVNITPQWRKRLRVVIVLSVLVSGIFVSQLLVEILLAEL